MYVLDIAQNLVYHYNYVSVVLRFEAYSIIVGQHFWVSDTQESEFGFICSS